VNLNYTDLEKKAIDFAREAHKGQKRQKTGEPYHLHVLKVGETLKFFHYDEPTVVAGFLHDVIEDTKYTFDNIVEEFGEPIADIVWDCTDPPNVRGNLRRQGKLEKIDKLANNAPAVRVQIADLTDNVESIGACVQKFGEDTFSQFGAGIGILLYYNEKYFRLYSKLLGFDDRYFLFYLTGIFQAVGTVLDKEGLTQKLKDIENPF
jgi:(p)ppGpp synthase/HD superfamily hydrolase